MTDDSGSLAAVILAHVVAEPARVQAMADAAREAGSQPVVVVLARGVDSPADLRITRVSSGASTISALRAGMALLTNTTAHLALILPLGEDAWTSAQLLALADTARREPAAVTAFEGADLDRSPVIVSRDAWLDVVTLGEQGLGAVANKRGVNRVRLKV